MRSMEKDAVVAAGGAALGSFLNVLFDRMTPKRSEDSSRRQKLSARLLHKLKTAMESVRGVLNDAEEKEITRPAVKQWLDHIKNALFEADDLFDEINYEDTRLELDAESRSTIDGTLKFLCPRKSCKKGLNPRLMEIVETIKDLVKQKDALGLIENIGGGQSTQRIPTTSLVETSNIFGRKQDQEAITEMLLSDDVNRSNRLSIISIVGLGGIGKTALAQLIYRDGGVQSRYKFRGWVCVSEEFDVPKITRDIAKEVAQMTCDDKTLNQIHVELGKKLTGKRFLLVLDDVWNGSFTDWDILLNPLKSGDPGSKIIITTRNEGVATTVSSSSIFRLHVLALDDCQKLFREYAFDDQNSHDPRLEEIGKRIVERCDGLPLAVKVMGGVLRSKRNVKDWKNFLRNDMWEVSTDDILPVLRLSYRYLPSHLKQCFVTCSIFPKRYEFKKEQLILLWMAEGFLIEKGNKTMEEVGEEYFEELVSRSFFQHVNNSFVMHDLINDLARDVAGDFCLRFENQDFCRTFDKLRYFSCVAVKEESSSRQLSNIFESRLLRTFLLLSNTPRENNTPQEKQGQKLQKMIPDLFLNQQRLRVLYLSRCENLVDLPSSICCLERHLRYLDLSFTSIENLPECLCSFYNLQTLNLRSCQELAKLPTKMGRLINMRHLDIKKTKLQETPSNMGKLKKLQTLTDFFVGKRKGCGVKELGSLQHLRGELKIHNLQNVVNAEDALEAKIKCKENLKKLKLYWDGYGDDSRHQDAVLCGLEPHTEIEVIAIDGYRGNSFPNWLESGAFPCLKKLSVKSCPNLKGALPSHLSSFTKLVIQKCPQLQICSSNAPNFSSLGLIKAPGPTYSGSSIYLEIINIQESVLEKIGQLGSFFEEITIARHQPLKCFPLELFPKLESLKIEECPHFESFCTPNQEFVSSEFLTMLILEDCPKLKCLPECMHSLFPALLTLQITGCPEIETFSSDGLPLKLQSLTISDCKNLIAGHWRWDLQRLTSLSSLTIRDYRDEMECFPDYKDILPSGITSLEICNFLYLKSLSYIKLQRLEKLIIKNCPMLQLDPYEQLHSAVDSLGCVLNLGDVDHQQNEQLSMDTPIPPKKRFKYFSSLRELGIWDCDAIESLSEEVPPSLIALELHNLQKLKSVEGLGHLTSLQKLTISSCPHLETLPDGGLPSSVTFLKISCCGPLQKRYGKNTGKYWAKISHIPHIDIS